MNKQMDKYSNSDSRINKYLELICSATLPYNCRELLHCSLYENGFNKSDDWRFDPDSNNKYYCILLVCRNQIKWNTNPILIYKITLQIPNLVFQRAHSESVQNCKQDV